MPLQGFDGQSRAVEDIEAEDGVFRDRMVSETEDDGLGGLSCSRDFVPRLCSELRNPGQDSG